MLKKIIDALAGQDLSDWQIREVRRRSFQSFLAKEKRECARTVETVSYLVSLFQARKSPASITSLATNGSTDKPHDELDDVLGMASFKIGPQNAGAIATYVDDALFAAQLVSNQPFELPEQPDSVSDVLLADDSLSAASLRRWEERLLEAVRKEERTRLSSAEFFADTIETRLVNSRGLDLSQRETVLHTEFILLSADAGRENEYIDRYSRRLENDFDIEAEVAQSAQAARDATVAQLPRTGSFPVLLSDEPLDQLFNPIVARASARLKYNKMVSSAVGKSVVADGEAKGDLVTLWSNPLRPGALGSSRFDSYGTPGRRLCLVEKNVLKSYIADKRYADYLSLPATGEAGTIEIEPGSRPFDALRTPPDGGVLYHLQAFSAFEPNAITGAFSAEIRAGYEISARGVRPIKGGSVSGVLQRDLLDCRFSREQVQRERVFVPKGVLFNKLTIAGA